MHSFDTAGLWTRLGVGILSAAATWLGATLIGSVVAARALGVARRIDRIALGSAIGYLLVGSLVALFALAHGQTSLVAATPIVCALAALLLARRSVGQPAHAGPRLNLVEKFGIMVFVAAVVTGLVAAALPTVWWDPLAYHLPILDRAARVHAFSFDPAMTQTGFPLLGEAGALPAYIVGGSAAANLVTLGAGIALALVCGSIAAAYEPRARWLATALVSSAGLWLWLAPSFYVDVPFALFALAALGVAIAPNLVPDETARAAVSGLLAGAAAAVKLPGLIFAALPALFVFSRPSRETIREAGLFAAAFVVVAGPWYLRSFLLTGDPTYPFLTASLAHDEALRGFAERYVTMTRNWCGGGYSLGDFMLAPFRLLSDPRQYCGDPGYALRVGIVFFAAAALTVRQLRIPAAVALGLGAIWFVENHQGRFLIPALCVYAIVVAGGAVRFDERFRGLAAALLLALGTFGVMENWVPATIADAPNSLVPAYSYVAGRESGEGYLARRLESFDASAWLRNRLVAGGAKVLALDDVRDYYFGPDTVWGNPYYQPVWNVDWALAPKMRYAALESSGFGYMVVNANAAYVRRTPTGVDWPVLASDERAGVIRRVFAANDVVVYELENR